MPDRQSTTTSTRRLAWLVVAFSCALLAEPAVSWPSAAARAGTALEEPPSSGKKPSPKGKRPKRKSTTSKPTSEPAESQPTSAGGVETVPFARRRLVRIPVDKRTPNEHALLAALDFTIAVGRVDTKRIQSLVDAIGYQPLPLSGELPERPNKAVQASKVADELGDRKPMEVSDLPVELFEVFARGKLAAEYPAVASWMLEEDRAVVFRAPDPPHAHWIQRDSLLVIRIRGDRATIVGGELLAALGEVPDSLVPAGEDK